MQPQSSRISRVCAVCGKSFTVFASRLRTKACLYCSRACQYEGQRTSPELRFWANVEQTDTCWIWKGHLTPNGYGQIWIGPGRGRLGAHRFSWMIHHGAIGSGLLVLHNCPGRHNRRCVNPAHLKLGDSKENAQDRDAQGTTFRQHGSLCPTAKLIETQVIEIRERWASGEVSRATLAREYGVNTSAISKIVLRTRWKHIP